MMLNHAIGGMDRLERLALRNSAIHRLHPMAKLLTTIAYVVVVLSFPSQNFSGMLSFLLYPAVLTPWSGTPYWPLTERLLLALPFSLMGGVANLILLRETVFIIGGFSVTRGMISFASIMLKTLLSVFAVLLLIAVTSFAEIARQLARLGMPNILCLQLVMTYRYLSVLLIEAASMFTAYILRASGEKAVKMKDMGSFLGQLVLRSFDRAERVYQAMKCRGFQGVYYGKARDRFRRCDYIYVSVFMAGLMILRWFNLSLFLGELIM
ncbi:MAG: cobalt ECF transporter T component CbiQ [Synergistaceae bacterium]|jgi:cobalt/nickel transport system permease protein|nr:cobalt ECF transporter T component CbiQ [Synergistaceae bacterium]